MTVHVARQPIFNRKEQTVAYELLYRDSDGKHPGTSINGDEATIEVLANSLLNIGLDKLSRGKQVYINFTENLLLQHFPEILPAEKIVIELLEEIETTAGIKAACKELKAKGYTLALDDFLLRDENKELIQYADIIKVDFLNTTKAERGKMKRDMAGLPLIWLAEKVETREHLQEALDEGFFFAEPTIISAKSIPQFSGRYFVILHEVMSSEPNVYKIAKLIEADLSLSYKLLKLLNRTVFIQRKKIKTIHQAIMLIGLDELKKWLFVMMFSSSDSMCSEEVIRVSLVRAKTLELLALCYLHDEPSSLFFLLGMLSMIDVFIHKPIEVLLQDLPVDEKIKEALLFEDGTLFQLLHLIVEMERGHWTAVSEISHEMQMEERVLLACYQDAFQWADMIIKTEAGLDYI
ncbi:EAL and HDOD domain-containing protein [Pseudobacillus sp. 179-B 2D1 NHS]|uniref:EAL and HDOD domain-containing protein n=1 Tax=Pseudobacillus sp. 179-B 2D1 NHS TaxID=3374292 RepID=UPI003879E12D